MSSRLRFFLGSVLFLFAAGFLLVAILGIAKLRFPKQPDLLGLLTQSGGGGPTTGKGMLERMLQRWRQQPHIGGRSQRSGAAERATRGYGGKDTTTGPGGSLQYQLPNDQLALRETAEAASILSSQFGVDIETGWRQFRQVPVKGTFTPFERERFLSGVLIQRYFEGGPHGEGKRDPLVMQQLQQSISQAVSLPEADFEDFFTAGVATLFQGDPLKAEEYLSRAEQGWPAPGRAFGDVYLLLTWTYAIEGHSAEVIRRMSNDESGRDAFKSVFPDWLYVETFMPDLDDLQKRYPTAPLLDVTRGRLYYYVGDFAHAEAAWNAALASPRLDAVASSAVRRWLLELRREARESKETAP